MNDINIDVAAQELLDQLEPVEPTPIPNGCKAVTYDSDGNITQIADTTLATGEVLAQQDNVIVWHGSVSFNDYVIDGEIRSKPELPKRGFYVWSTEQESWIFDLAKAKAATWETIKAKRDKNEYSTFEWNTHIFQCDEVSQRRIHGAMQIAQVDAEVSMVWTLLDNSTVTLTAAEIIEVSKALVDHVKQCHDRGRILREQINAATTLEDLEAISW